MFPGSPKSFELYKWLLKRINKILEKPKNLVENFSVMTPYMGMQKEYQAQDTMALRSGSYPIICSPVFHIYRIYLMMIFLFGLAKDLGKKNKLYVRSMHMILPLPPTLPFSISLSLSLQV